MEPTEQLREAMAASEDLPEERRWAMTMELLPDSFLSYAVRARERPNADASLTLYGLLGLVVLQEWLDEDEEEAPDGELVAVAIFGVLTSLYAELERRHQQFCDDV